MTSPNTIKSRAHSVKKVLFLYATVKTGDSVKVTFGDIETGKEGKKVLIGKLSAYQTPRRTLYCITGTDGKEIEINPYEVVMIKELKHNTIVYRNPDHRIGL